MRIDRCLALIVAGVAVPLLGLSLMMFPVRLIHLRGDGVREALVGRKVVTGDQLNLFEQTRTTTLGWHETAGAWTDLAMGAMSRKDYLKVREREERALALAPANPYGWAALAYVLLQTEGPTTRAKEALRLSVLTGPQERKLASSRRNIAKRLLP